MNIKTKFPQNNRSYIVARLSFLTLILFLLSYTSVSLEQRYQKSRKSLFRWPSGNTTHDSIWEKCNISYDNCRCSVMTNKTDASVECISDTAAMAGHLLPLVSYALQIYAISTLFSFTGKYSGLLTDICCFVALFIFVIIAIAVHGSSCLYSYTSLVIAEMNILLIIFFMYVIKRSHNHNSAHEIKDTHNHERVVVANNQGRTTTHEIKDTHKHERVVVANNQGRKTTITITVS